MKTRLILLPALLAAGCGPGVHHGDQARLPATLAARLGAPRPLMPLRVKANLPPGARVEDLSREGLPRHVGVTSVQPELIFDIEEVDDLSPTYAEIVRFGGAAIAPNDSPRVRRNERRDDGTFALVVEHTTRTPGLAVSRSYTVDMRVAAGGRQFDCTGTATAPDVVDRMIATCEALQPL